jgi:hypothetical protein
MRTPAFVQPSTHQKTWKWAESVIESAMNWVFSLKHTAGTYRNLVRTVALLLFYFFAVITLHDLDGWIKLFRLLNVSQSGQLLYALGEFLYKTFLNPIVIRNLIAVIAPYYLIHRLAAIYLADIFEKETSVANHFLAEAAFATGYQTIRVSGGRLAERNHNSPIVEIGGPGFVTVDLDSAIVLEGPYGGMRVIGPTAKLPRGRAIIEDFERIRQCIDLRDIINKQEIVSRSKDGIIVKVRDVQYSYSVYRGENRRKSLDSPYPFNEESIKSLVTGVFVPVSQFKQPDSNPEWNRPLPSGLFVSINIEFNNFINQHSLGEFFSAVGPPEEKALEERAQKIFDSAGELAGQDGYQIQDNPFRAGPVEYRPALAEKLFGTPQFKGFMTKKGLQVNWIGVGTWETSDEIILENHLDAWQTSIENQKKGDPEKLNETYDTSRNNKLVQLINELPINTYYRLTDKSDREIVDTLFNEYIKYLLGVSQYFADRKQNMPASINTAIESLNKLRFYEVGGDYYTCVKTSYREDSNIAGAICYTIEVFFSTLPLQGCEINPVRFDFGDRTERAFTFLAQISDNTTLSPNTPQTQVMQIDDLYVQTSFQVTIPPDTNNLLEIEIWESQKPLSRLSLELNP